MSRSVYFGLFVVSLGFAAVGQLLWFSLPVPPSADIELRSVEEFFAAQFYVSIGLGALVGAVMASSAPRRLLHTPSDRGIDYLERVVRDGIVGALVAVGCVFVVETLMAAVWSIEPLVLLDKIFLIVPSGLFVVLLASAAAAALAVYALVSRSITWGGQYALLAAPKF